MIEFKLVFNILKVILLIICFNKNQVISNKASFVVLFYFLIFFCIYKVLSVFCEYLTINGIISSQ